MKKYYLDVITGVGGNGINRYEVDADGYEYLECGVYRFYVKEDKNSRWTETIASYPIHKTIIRHISQKNVVSETNVVSNTNVG
jgi:hypothetical protein